MGIFDQIKSGSLKVTAEQRESAQAIVKGAKVVVEVAEEVIIETSPDDDSALELTALEAGMIALKRLGLKVGN